MRSEDKRGRATDRSWPTMRTTAPAVAAFGLRWLLATAVIVTLVVLAHLAI